MLDTCSPIKEIKKNVGRGGTSEYFMGLGGNAVKVRKMVSFDPDVFPSNKGILFLYPKYHSFSLSEILLGSKTIHHFEDVDGQ